MANLGDDMWRHAEEGKTASIRLIRLQYSTRCQSKKHCDHRATVGIECRDKLGHPIWRKDFCAEHAKLLIERAKARGIEAFWHK
jgi:hypothetical protein